MPGAQKKWDKELVPKITIFVTAESAENGPKPAADEKVFRLKQRFSPQRLEPRGAARSFENGCVFAEPFDAEFCPLKRGDFLFDVVISDFLRFESAIFSLCSFWESIDFCSF